MRRAKWLLLLVVFAMVVAACSSDDSDDETTTTAAAGEMPLCGDRDRNAAGGSGAIADDAVVRPQRDRSDTTAVARMFGQTGPERLGTGSD